MRIIKTRSILGLSVNFASGSNFLNARDAHRS
jgi:hypothetical protein